MRSTYPLLSLTLLSTTTSFTLPPSNLQPFLTPTSRRLTQSSPLSTPTSSSSSPFQNARNPTNLRSDPNDGWLSPSGPAASSTMSGGTGLNNSGEAPFEIRGFSLGNAVVAAGLAVTVLSFADYLGQSSTSSAVSGLGFVYGIPIVLAGSALKYAEIEPVPCFTKPGSENTFEAKATETMQKIKQDVTRHRYGDEAHLDTTVKRLGLVLTGKAYPQLRELREETTEEGELVFTIVWQSLDTPYKMWADPNRVAKYATFFGPGVEAECVKISAEEKLVAIRLTTTGKVPEKEEEVAAPAPFA